MWQASANGTRAVPDEARELLNCKDLLCGNPRTHQLLVRGVLRQSPRLRRCKNGNAIRLKLELGSPQCRSISEQGWAYETNVAMNGPGIWVWCSQTLNPSSGFVEPVQTFVTSCNSV